MGRQAVPQPTDGGDDVICVHRSPFAALDDGLLHHLQRVLSQQLQDSNILPGSGFRALTVLKVGSQLIKAGRQLPSVKHKRMIQGRRTTTEDRQIMPGLHDPSPSPVAALMTGNHPQAIDHLDPIHVRLDSYRLESPATRHTVAVRIEPNRLILVYLCGLRDERIEGTRRQGQSSLLVLLKRFPDRLHLARHNMVPLGQSARLQVGIQLSHVLNAGNRRRPVPLQIVHAVFHVGFFIAPRRHAEAWIEAVMARQSRVTRLQPTPPAPQDGCGHRLGIIPPDLPRHTTEERKALDHARQDCLDLFAWQPHRKTKARKTPGQQQDRDLLAAVGKVHVNVSEIRLQTATRRMGQRQKRLPLDTADPANVPPDLIVAARVTVLIPQTTIELRRRVLLLARRLPILGQDLLDQRLVRSQTWGRPILPQSVRPRLTLAKNLPDLTSGMTKPPGNLTNAQPIAMGKPYLAIIFHRQHPFFSVNCKTS